MNLVQSIQHQPQPHHLHLQGQYNLTDLAIPQADNPMAPGDRQLSSRKVGRSRITTTRASERITTAIPRNTSNTAATGSSSRSSTSSSQGNMSSIINHAKLGNTSNYYVPSLAVLGRKELHYSRMTASTSQQPRQKKMIHQLGGNLVQSASKPTTTSTSGVKPSSQSQKIHPAIKNNNNNTSAAKNGRQSYFQDDIQQRSILGEVSSSYQSPAAYMDRAQTSDRFYHQRNSTELANHANSLGLCRFYDLKRMLKIDDFQNTQHQPQQERDQLASWEQQMMMLGIDEQDRRIHLQEFKQKVMAFLRILHLDKHNVSRKKLQKCFRTIDIASQKCEDNSKKKNHAKNEYHNSLEHTSKSKQSNEQQDTAGSRSQQEEEFGLSSSRSRNSNNSSADHKDCSADLLSSSCSSNGWRSKRYYQINQHQFEELPLHELCNLSPEESQRYHAILTHLREIGRTFTVNVPGDSNDAFKTCNNSSKRTKATAAAEDACCLFTESSSITGMNSAESKNTKSPKNKRDAYDFILEPTIQQLENTAERGTTYYNAAESNHNSSFESCSSSSASPAKNRSIRLVLPSNMKIRGQAFNDFYEYVEIKQEVREVEQVSDMCNQITSSLGDSSNGIDVQEGVLKTEPSEEMGHQEEAAEIVEQKQVEGQDGKQKNIEKVEGEELSVIALSIPVIEEQAQQNEVQDETESNASSDNRTRSRLSSKGKGKYGNKGAIDDNIIERQESVVAVPSSESIGWSKSCNNNKNMYPPSSNNSRPASNYQPPNKKIAPSGSSSNSKPASASSTKNNNNSESQKRQQQPKGTSSYSKDKDGDESDGFEEAPQEEVKELTLQATNKKESNIPGHSNPNQLLSNQTSLQLKIPANSSKSDEIGTMDKEITSNSAIRQKSQTTNRNNGQNKDKNSNNNVGGGNNRRRGETVGENNNGQKRQQQQQQQQNRINSNSNRQQALHQMSMKERIQTEIRIEEEEKQRQQMEQNRVEYVQLGSGLIDRILQETAKAQQITNNNNTNDFNILDFDLAAYFVTQSQQQQSNQQTAAAVSLASSPPPNINTHHVTHQTQADKMLFTKLSRWQLETEEDFYEYQEQLLSSVLAIHGKVRTVVPEENQVVDELSSSKITNSKSTKYEKSRSQATGLSQTKSSSKQSKATKNRAGKEQSESNIKNGFTIELSNDDGTEIEIAQIAAENPSQNCFTDKSLSSPPSQILNISRQQSSNLSAFNQTPNLSREPSSFKTKDEKMSKLQKNNSKDTVIRKDSRCSESDYEDDKQDEDQEEEEEEEKANNSSDSGSRSSQSHSSDSMEKKSISDLEDDEEKKDQSERLI